MQERAKLRVGFAILSARSFRRTPCRHRCATADLSVTPNVVCSWLTPRVSRFPDLSVPATKYWPFTVDRGHSTRGPNRKMVKNVCNRVVASGGTVLLAAALAGCGGSPLTTGIPTWTPQAASAKTAAAPSSPALARVRPFTCPHEKQVRAVTAKAYTARPENSDAWCAYDLPVEGRAATGYVIMHPPASVGPRTETLMDYRHDFEKYTQVEDAPDFGPDAFVVEDRMLCAVWMTASDGQVAMVQFNNFTSDQIGNCDFM